MLHEIKCSLGSKDKRMQFTCNMLSIRKGVPNIVFNDKSLQNIHIIGRSFSILLLNYRLLQKDMLSRVRERGGKGRDDQDNRRVHLIGGLHMSTAVII